MIIEYSHEINQGKVLWETKRVKAVEALLSYRGDKQEVKQGNDRLERGKVVDKYIYRTENNYCQCNVDKQRKEFSIFAAGTKTALNRADLYREFFYKRGFKEVPIEMGIPELWEATGLKEYGEIDLRKFGYELSEIGKERLKSRG